VFEGRPDRASASGTADSAAPDPRQRPRRGRAVRFILSLR